MNDQPAPLTYRVIDRGRMRLWSLIYSPRERLQSLVILETDDWVEACSRALTTKWRQGEELCVEGVHLSHVWDDRRPRRCVNCNGWDNGSYGSKAPCGYTFNGSLVQALAREQATRQVAKQ